MDEMSELRAQGWGETALSVLSRQGLDTLRFCPVVVGLRRLCLSVDVSN